MNVGEIVLYDYYGTYPAPVAVFMTRDSWTEGAPYHRPAVGYVHVMPIEQGYGIMEDVAVADLLPLGGA